MTDNDQEKRWRKMWKERKYHILGKIRNATSREDASGQKGIDIHKLADVLELPPRETQGFVKAMIEWGATVYVKDNRVYTHDSPNITSGRKVDLIPFQEINVVGEAEKVQGIRFGIVSDTHFGSTRTNLSVLKEAYHHFESEGITDVILAGNLLAGMLPKEYRRVDLQVSGEGLEQQVEILAKNFPKVEEIKTHFLLGHRDYKYKSRDEVFDPAVLINQARPDLNYLGDLEADLIFNPEGKKPFTVRVTNDKLYYYYSISYQPQKKLENMAGGERPTIWLVGGTQQTWQSRYQGVEINKLPGLQNQTSRMRHRAYLANVGFEILNIVAREKRADLYAEIVFDFTQGPGIGSKNEVVKSEYR